MKLFFYGQIGTHFLQLSCVNIILKITGFRKLFSKEYYISLQRSKETSALIRCSLEPDCHWVLWSFALALKCHSKSWSVFPPAG